ncbi:MAG: membrane protein insertion efficiency factor YidD [Lentisphaeria bacterium]|nr:membrane protein insertion efficiency factor YidD [Lentisphaeria bacterium]
MSGLLLLLLRLYKLCISPYLPRCCRFHPSCSAYAADAVMKHGAIKGGCLTLFRLLRCQPFCKGGYDPVPDEFSLKGLFCKWKDPGGE